VTRDVADENVRLAFVGVGGNVDEVMFSQPETTTIASPVTHDTPVIDVAADANQFDTCANCDTDVVPVDEATSAIACAIFSDV
jgi:hypothetical protein